MRKWALQPRKRFAGPPGCGLFRGSVLDQTVSMDLLRRIRVIFYIPIAFTLFRTCCLDRIVRYLGIYVLT